MQKVIVSSGADKFQGSFEIVYGEPGMGENTYPPLEFVDMRGVVMNDVQKAYLLKVVPVRLAPGFEAAFGGNLKFVYDEFEVTFDDFWTKFDHKLNRLRCEKLWNKMSKKDRILAVMSLDSYFRYLMRNTWLTKMNPETYLFKKCWLNNYDNL